MLLVALVLKVVIQNGRDFMEVLPLQLLMLYVRIFKKFLYKCKISLNGNDISGVV